MEDITLPTIEKKPFEFYLETLRNSIRNIPDFPKPGIQFKDISTLLNNENNLLITTLCIERCLKDNEIAFNKVAGIESRGFIFGSCIAMDSLEPFVMVRKPGKLPVETISQEYQLEYGTDKIEVTYDAFKPGDEVLLVDDLLATGGTLEAAAKLVEKCGAKVAGIAVVIELEGLGGRERLSKYPLVSLVKYTEA